MREIFRSPQAVSDVLPLGKTVTLVGGCFDLFHVGHLHLLEYASTLEDLLVVAVLSDKFIQGYKDPKRPVINELDRARIVASTRYADYVYIADKSPSSSETLRALRPFSVVFGEEAGKEQRIKERTELIRTLLPLTRVEILPRYEAERVSTCHIVSKILGAEDACPTHG